jgi:hypothetical protein
LLAMLILSTNEGQFIALAPLIIADKLTRL